MNCNHNGNLEFQEVQIKAGDLIIHVTCRQCGTSGSYILDPEDVLWPEDDPSTEEPDVKD